MIKMGTFIYGILSDKPPENHAACCSNTGDKLKYPRMTVILILWLWFCRFLFWTLLQLACQFSLKFIIVEHPKNNCKTLSFWTQTVCLVLSVRFTSSTMSLTIYLSLISSIFIIHVSTEYSYETLKDKVTLNCEYDVRTEKEIESSLRPFTSWSY